MSSYPLGRTSSVVTVNKNPNKLMHSFSLPSIQSYARTCSLYKPKVATYYTGVYYPKRYYRDFRINEDYSWRNPCYRSYYFRSPHALSLPMAYYKPSYRFYTKDSWYPYNRHYDPYHWREPTVSCFTPDRSWLYGHLLH